VLTLVPRKHSFLDSAYPLGAAVGALGGAVAGAALGWGFGPLGAAVGALVGAVAGGTGGYGFGEAARPYGGEVIPFDAVLEAPLRHGWDQYVYYKGRALEDVRPDVRRSWDATSAAERDGR
jgi:hypothetical protein